jgi:hypothetical protein
VAGGLTAWIVAQHLHYIGWNGEHASLSPQCKVHLGSDGKVHVTTNLLLAEWLSDKDASKQRIVLRDGLQLALALEYF